MSPYSISTNIEFNSHILYTVISNNRFDYLAKRAVSPYNKLYFFMGNTTWTCTSINSFEPKSNLASITAHPWIKRHDCYFIVYICRFKYIKKHNFILCFYLKSYIIAIYIQAYYTYSSPKVYLLYETLIPLIIMYVSHHKAIYTFPYLK